MVHKIIKKISLASRNYLEPEISNRANLKTVRYSNLFELYYKVKDRYKIVDQMNVYEYIETTEDKFKARDNEVIKEDFTKG